MNYILLSCVDVVSDLVTFKTSRFTSCWLTSNCLVITSHIAIIYYKVRPSNNSLFDMSPVTDSNAYMFTHTDISG